MKLEADKLYKWETTKISHLNEIPITYHRQGNELTVSEMIQDSKNWLARNKKQYIIGHYYFIIFGNQIYEFYQIKNRTNLLIHKPYAPT